MKDQIELNGRDWELNCSNGESNWRKQWEFGIKLKKYWRLEESCEVIMRLNRTVDEPNWFNQWLDQKQS